MPTNYAQHRSGTPQQLSDAPCLYDITKSYADNFRDGPRFEGKIPPRQHAPRSEWLNFLGTPVASAIGVPAGPLLSAKWTTLAADLGYDIVTYKTIRSRPHPGHPLPNILYVDCREQLDPATLPDSVTASLQHRNKDYLAITNSFGMPSQAVDFLRSDITNARQALSEGQALVVSVTGSPDATVPLADDFAAAAKLAVDCGAPIIEANFSCPNVAGAEGSLYLSPTNAADVVAKIKATIGDTPLIIKVGTFSEKSTLQDLLCRIADAGAAAVSGINTISMTVTDEIGMPALGPDRPTSGVCGGPIRTAGLRFVSYAREVIDRCDLALTLIGVGGITSAQHVDQFLAAGANFAQSATGMMWNPYLAAQYHLSHQ